MTLYIAKKCLADNIECIRHFLTLYLVYKTVYKTRCRSAHAAQPRFYVPDSDSEGQEEEEEEDFDADAYFRDVMVAAGK